MIKKIIHSADWHMYLYKRHEEFETTIEQLCEKAEIDFEGLKYEERLFVIAGDLFHEFTKPSNEANLLMGAVLKKMADIARIVIIAGESRLQ
jgi:DNA repair exonuclease SbcCD nuclease subunit